MTLKPSLALAALSLAIATSALAGAAIQTGDTAKGAVLTDGNGLSLYTFDKDTPAVSNCYDDCAAKWPPLEAANTARPQGAFGIQSESHGFRARQSLSPAHGRRRRALIKVVHRVIDARMLGAH